MSVPSQNAGVMTTSGFQSNSLEAVGGILQRRQQCFRFARKLHFPNDLAKVIHNANAAP